MSNFKPIDDRQVVNRAPLTHIGSPANDTLDDIFNKIDAALSGNSSGAGYVAKEVALTSGIGTTSYVVTIPVQPDTSYIPLSMFENLIDPTPQFQQVEITAKSTTGFTISWNIPLDTNNYVLSYIVPYKQFSVLEFPIGSGTSSVVETNPLIQSSSTYPIMVEYKNTVDAHPQFQSALVTAQSSTTTTISSNVPTDTANYSAIDMFNATAQITLNSGTTNTSVVLPVAYSTNGFAVMASLSNLVDPTPKFQPLLVTGKESGFIEFQWPVALDSNNYSLTYYTVSLTP
jgi:hypothetical protein